MRTTFNDHTQLEEEQALILAAQGDPAAFESLYSCYVEQIYRYVRSQLANKEDASDITQQIFLQAFRSLPQYRLGGSFRAWIFGIARHVIGDVRRMQHATISWEDVPESAHPLDMSWSPEETALQNEAYLRIRNLLQRLHPDKRELLALYVTGKLTVAEIAVVLDKKPGAVKKQLSRTLKALREQYHATEQ